MSAMNTRRVLIFVCAVLVSAGVSLPCLAGRRRSGLNKKAAGIDAVSERVVEAYKTKNSDALLSCYADHFMSGKYRSKEELAESVESLFGRYETIRLTRVRAMDADIQEPYAWDVVDRVFIAERADPPERMTRAGRILIAYEKVGNDWLITGEEEIDIETEKSLISGKYVDLRAGYEVSVPRGWKAHVVRGSLGSMLLLSTGDLKSSLYMGRMLLPSGVNVESMLQEDMEASRRSAGAESVDEGDVSLAGMKGRQVTADITVGERKKRIRRSYFVDDRFLFLVIASSESASAFEKAQSGFEKIFASLEVGDPQADPSLGVLSDGVYTNRMHDCRFEMPQDYDARLEKGPGEFSVVFSSRDGAVDGTLVCLDPPLDVSIELLVMADEYKTSQVGVNYELLGNGVVSCANVDGYGTLSTFEMSGKTKTRRRAYFVSGNYLYCVLMNVSPSDQYTSKNLELETLVKSIHLGK